MTDEQYAQLEPGAKDVRNEADIPAGPLLFSIAVSLKRMADDVEQIKHGYKFICERWGSGSWGNK
jgi:hypothetical protein